MSDLLIILYLFFEILAIVICLHDLYGERLRVDAWTVGLIVVDVLALYAMEKTGVGNEYSFVMYIIVIIYVIIKYGINYKKIIINSSVCLLAVSIVQFLLAIIYSIFVDIDENWKIFYIILNFSLLFIFYVFYRKKLFKKVSEIFSHYNSITIASLIFDVILLLGCINKAKQGKNVIILIILICIIAVVLIFLLAMNFIRTSIKNNQLSTAIRIQELYNDSFKSLISTIRTTQHEFDNHINAILGMCYTYKTYEELVSEQKLYFGEITENAKYNKLLSVSNATIAGFLYSKFSSIENKAELDITYKITCTSFECALPIYKMIEILGNLIDNAVDEISTLNDKGSLELIIAEKNNFIEIVLINDSKYIDYNIIKNIFKNGVSSKGETRGLGLYNVKKICDEYDILISCENTCINDESKFLVKLLINKDVPKDIN